MGFLSEMDERLEQLERDNATLRALLREAAPKCDYYHNNFSGVGEIVETCDRIATWEAEDFVEDYHYYFCDEHRQGLRAKKFDLGVRIKAILEEG